ncbi:MAG: Asd/ArgC dimerization domain-containing protein [bacterium]|nr:Asd/ArgC dimerization domain-containing protein [bacterium]
MPRIIVLGASGALGREVTTVLGEYKFETDQIKLFASSKSVGEEIDCGSDSLEVFPLERYDIKAGDFIFSCLPTSTAKELLPDFVAKGGTVLDVSGAFATLSELPVCLAEINGDAIRQFKRANKGKGSLLRVPCPAATALALTVNPLQKLFPIRSITVTSLCSVAAWGRKAMDELWGQTTSLLQYGETEAVTLPGQLAFNCLTSIGEIDEKQNSSFENLVIGQLVQLIPGLKNCLSYSAAMIPVFSADTHSVTIDFETTTTTEIILSTLRESPGIVLFDEVEPETKLSPLEAAFIDGVCVSRLRASNSTPIEGAAAQKSSNTASISLWAASDALRRGSAISAVHILEIYQESEQ